MDRDGRIKTSKKYDSGFSKINYDKIFARLNEAKEWKRNFEKEERAYKGNHVPLVDKLNSFLGYFSNIRDKLKDEVVFGKNNLRDLSIQIRRLERDLESRRSELEIQVKERDSIRKEYEALQLEKDKALKNSSDYLNLQERCYYKKKEKEDIEATTRKNTLVCQNLIQNSKVMQLSAEQNIMSLNQAKEILENVEKSIEDMNFMYRTVVTFIQAKKPVLQITSGGSDV